MPGTVEQAFASSEKWCPRDICKIETDELIAMIKNNEAIVIDVRTRPELEVSRLACSLTLSEFEEAVKRGACENKNVIVMCTVGKRSGDFARKLKQEKGNWKNIFNSRGIIHYSHHPDAQIEGPTALVNSNGKPATHLHVFASPWDLGSPELQSVRFGPISILLASIFPSLL